MRAAWCIVILLPVVVAAVTALAAIAIHPVSHR